MKRHLPLFAFSLLLLISITGCSVVRFAETRIGHGVKRANKTDLDLDFQLGFNAANRSLMVTLEYQPYSIYKPRITSTDLGIGLTALGLFGKIYYDHWNHKNTFTLSDDTFDWYGTETWEKALLIGVPIDILLYWGLAYPFDRKAVRHPKEPLTDQEYRLSLPDHGDVGIDYRTTSGSEQIPIQDFLSALRYRPNLENVDSLKVRALTEVGYKPYTRDYIIKGAIPPPFPTPVPRPVEVEVDVQSVEVDVQSVEVDVQWMNSRLRAGERATLRVVVKNTGRAVLTNFTVKTVSSDPNFNSWVLAFGNIAQGVSETRRLRCVTDENMQPPETVSVLLQFEDVNGPVHPEIETQLKIIR